ncbi:MAG: cytochrome oxidase subunit III, partial [SAR202 cluster bacterium]|nr:cytochrome oxidase subunit III [SAR202 cluster bacterium]
MLSETAIINNHQDEIENTSTGLSNKKLMMWLFLASDVMFFGA